MTLRTFLLSAAVSASALVSGQFYPDSSASWVSYISEPFDWYYVMYYMAPTPDTSIAGETYKIINEYSKETGDWVHARSYYVRSGTDGKGYAFLLDSMAEYITGDTAALAGDTMHNILGWYDIYAGPCGDHFHEYAPFDVIVDSVVTYSNNGVTVHRQFLTIPCAFDMNMPQPYFVFWQAGMGTSFGPLLRVGSPMGQNQYPTCAVSGGVSQFGTDGLPGGPPCFWPITLGVQEGEHENRTTAHPNPSTGLFTLDARMRTATVYDATGRLLFQTTGTQIDISAYPPGLYHAVVRTAQGVGHVRLMVQR